LQVLSWELQVGFEMLKYQLDELNFGYSMQTNNHLTKVMAIADFSQEFLRIVIQENSKI
jgi:hypothetical protein